MIDRSVDLLLKRSRMRVRLSCNLRDNVTRCVERSLKAIARSRQLIATSEALLDHPKSIDADGRYLMLHRTEEAEKDLLPVVSRREFDYELISADGKHFCECAFRRCTLVYGGRPVTFESCRFHECRFEFSGPAGRTIQFLECFGLLAGRATDPSGFDSPTEFLN